MLTYQETKIKEKKQINNDESRNIFNKYIFKQKYICDNLLCVNIFIIDFYETG